MAAERPPLFERMIMAIAPRWGLARARARLLARNYEAAQAGRRTSGWGRALTDPNAAAQGAQLAYLRAHARDLVRNNPWARRGLQTITRNTVGWGIRPNATGGGAERVMELFRRWGETTDCDAAGRLTFFGLQRQVMRTVVEAGEVLIRMRPRRLSDGLAIPLQLQLLEPDFIDTSRDGIIGEAGGPIVQGIEHDAIGRRVAYWLFDRHPGSIGAVMSSSGKLNPVSRRIPADGILHVFNQERPGQVRGPSWFASVDVRLHDFDEFEDATLMKHKIAACMAAFVTDIDGTNTPLGVGGTDSTTGSAIDSFEPGMIIPLPPGKNVQIANPPVSNDHQPYSATALRGVAAGLGVTYEDLTNDYSQVNFSSARMARIAHFGDVHDWRWNMLIPQFCAPAWRWMINALILAGERVEDAPAEWTPPPVPMVDPDSEGKALRELVRTGAMTPDEMVREQGFDPDQHWKEYAASLARLDKLGIVIDSDARRTTGQGQSQAPTTDTAAATPKNGAKPAANGKPAAPSA
jgi:lambda family phage portal protein